MLARHPSAAGDAPTATACADSQLPAARTPGRRSSLGWPASAPWRPVRRLVGWAPCASWPARSAERYTGPWNAGRQNPILVIGTTLDPATPYTNARHVARLLGNAILLTHDGYGHTSEPDPSLCIDHALSAYLIRPATARRQTCHADRQPFDPDWGPHFPGSSNAKTP